MATGTYEYRSDFARRYYAQGQAEGEAEGEAKAVLKVLEKRGVHVPAEVRARILECIDPAVTSIWLDRSFTVEAAQDLFD